MKKLSIMAAIIMMAMVFCASNAVADGCGEGIRSLSIDGGTSVGIQGYNGYSNSTVNTSTCFSNSVTGIHQNFNGTVINSSANGTGCLSKSGSGTGNSSITGDGVFRSGTTGSLNVPGTRQNAAFYTHSRVEISGNIEPNYCH